MPTRDRIVAAVAWWIGLVGLIGLALKPPIHPDARPHCVLGFLVNVFLLALQMMTRMELSLSPILWWVGFLAFFYGLTGTILALMGRPPLFFPRRAPAF